MTTTEKEWMDAMKNGYKDHTEIVFKQMIEYLRQAERDWRNDKGEFSGRTLIGQMLNEGTITIKMALDILPAVENPDTPYEITNIIT